MLLFAGVTRYTCEGERAGGTPCSRSLDGQLKGCAEGLQNEQKRADRQILLPSLNPAYGGVGEPCPGGQLFLGEAAPLAAAADLHADLIWVHGVTSFPGPVFVELTQYSKTGESVTR